MWRSVADDLGRVVALAGPPRRIVSLVPSVTELICDLGCGARLVGVTRFCVEPAAVVAGLPRLGGTKTADCERLVALRPDLVVMNSEENDRAQFDLLTAAGLPVFVSFATSVAGAARGVERLGAALDVDSAAGEVAQRIEDVAAALASLAPGAVRVFCPIWRRPWMSFNATTYCHDILRRAGARNVCAEAHERYPVVDLAAIALADPEVVLLPDEPYPFLRRHFADLEALHGTTSWRQGRVHLVDGRALSWYGARTPEALALFLRVLHPEVPLPDGFAGPRPCPAV